MPFRLNPSPCPMCITECCWEGRVIDWKGCIGPTDWTKGAFLSGWMGLGWCMMEVAEWLLVRAELLERSEGGAWEWPKEAERLAMTLP